VEERYVALQMALKDFFRAWKNLKDLKVLNNKKDFTSQLAEFIVASIYEGDLSTNSIQKDWDVILRDNRKIQVKSHAKATTNNNKFTPVPYKEDASIDLFVIIVFTEEYKIKHFYEIPWYKLWELSQNDKARRLVRWSKLNHFDRLSEIEFTDNELLKLFL
jgi:hypothetical protein